MTFDDLAALTQEDIEDMGAESLIASLRYLTAKNNAELADKQVLEMTALCNLAEKSFADAQDKLRKALSLQSISRFDVESSSSALWKAPYRRAKAEAK
jgi:hypothetical protein